MKQEVKRCITNIAEQWPNTEVEVLSLSLSATTSFSQDNEEDKDILTLIKGQNKELSTESWTIVHARNKYEGKDLKIRIRSMFLPS